MNWPGLKSLFTSSLTLKFARMRSSFSFALDLVNDEIGPSTLLRLCSPSHHCPIHFPHLFFKLPDWYRRLRILDSCLCASAGTDSKRRCHRTTELAIGQPLHEGRTSHQLSPSEPNSRQPRSASHMTIDDLTDMRLRAAQA